MTDTDAAGREYARRFAQASLEFLETGNQAALVAVGEQFDSELQPADQPAVASAVMGQFAIFLATLYQCAEVQFSIPARKLWEAATLICDVEGALAGSHAAENVADDSGDQS